MHSQICSLHYTFSRRHFSTINSSECTLQYTLSSKHSQAYSLSIIPHLQQYTLSDIQSLLYTLPYTSLNIHFLGAPLFHISLQYVFSTIRPPLYALHSTFSIILSEELTLKYIVFIKSSPLYTPHYSFSIIHFPLYFTFSIIHSPDHTSPVYILQ